MKAETNTWKGFCAECRRSRPKCVVCLLCFLSATCRKYPRLVFSLAYVPEKVLVPHVLKKLSPVCCVC